MFFYMFISFFFIEKITNTTLVITNSLRSSILNIFYSYF